MELGTINNINHNSRKSWFSPNHDEVWLVLALLIGICLRGYFLAQPMRYDESYTFLNFINQEIRHLFYYPLPSNHILHSILTKLIISIWGSHPVSIRLIAFLAGIALIPLVYVLCRTLNQSGVFASITLAVFPYFVLYSTNARGYTLAVLFTLSLALIGAQITKEAFSLSKTALFSLIAALGMLTMPSMLFPIAGVYLWIILLFHINGHTEKRVMYNFTMLSIVITSAITVLFYTPVILVSNGIQSIIANRFVKAQPWQEFISQIFSHFQRTLLTFTRDIPSALLLVFMILFSIAIYVSVKQKKYPSLLLLPSMIIMSTILLVIKQKIPFERTWIYLIPFFIVVADAGFTHLTKIVSAKVQSLLKISAICIAVFLSITLMTKNVIANYPDTGTFAEAEIVAKYLKPIMSSNDRIYAPIPADWPIYFYLWYHQVPQTNIIANTEISKDFYIVQKSLHSIDQLTDKPCIILINLGDLALYQAN